MDLNELQSLGIRELTELAIKFDIEGGVAGLNKQELTVRILEAQAKQDGSMVARGVLEVMQDGYGFLRSPDFNYLPGPDDIYVSPSQIKRFRLKTGHEVAGKIRPPKSKERFYALLKVEQVNDKPPEKIKDCILFENFTPLYPESKFNLEADEKNFSVASEKGLLPRDPIPICEILLSLAQTAALANKMMFLPGISHSSSGS